MLYFIIPTKMFDTYSSMSLATLGPNTINENRVTLNKTTGEFGFTNTFTSESATKLFNKPDYSLSTSDIFGASTKPGRKTNESSKILEIDDIEGSRARVSDKFLHTNRHINPLNPGYSLPSYTMAQPLVPKFNKDPLEIDDIDGTRTQKKNFTKAEKNPIDVSDIEGAQANWRPRHQ